MSAIVELYYPCHPRPMGRSPRSTWSYLIRRTRTRRAIGKIWRDLEVFTGGGNTCGSARSHRGQEIPRRNTDHRRALITRAAGHELKKAERRSGDGNANRNQAAKPKGEC